MVESHYSVRQPSCRRNYGVHQEMKGMCKGSSASCEDLPLQSELGCSLLPKCGNLISCGLASPRPFNSLAA